MGMITSISFITASVNGDIVVDQKQNGGHIEHIMFQ